MKVPAVVFWMPNPSQHVAPVLRAFAECWEGDVLGVWAATMPEARTALGWRAAVFGQLSEVPLDSDDRKARSQIDELVRAYPGAIHIFSGMKAYPRVYHAYRTARRDQAARLGLMVEPFRGWGFRRITRRLRSFLQGREYRRYVCFVLAMGRAGVAFYRMVGFGEEILFPFIYQSPMGRTGREEEVGRPLRLVYMGKFEPRKGVGDMLHGLGHTTKRDWTLTVIGDGPERLGLQKLAERYRVSDRVIWRGVVPHAKLMDELPGYDVAMVPSRFDGWGTVPNEAIHAGIATIVTEGCSSHDLIAYSGAGMVVPAAHPRALAQAVDRLVKNPEEVSIMKQRARNYAPSISGPAVAAYLGAVLEYAALGTRSDRPIAPWHRQGEEEIYH